VKQNVLKKKTFTEKLPWWIDMLNAKKVFRLDVATRKLISADAVQLKGDYSVIYDAKEILKSNRSFNQNQCSILPLVPRM
jgi:hypothetical protein